MNRQEFPELKPVKLSMNNCISLPIWVLEGTMLRGWNTAFVEGDVLDALKEDEKFWPWFGRAIRDDEKYSEGDENRYLDLDIDIISIRNTDGSWEKIERVNPLFVNEEGLYELVLCFDALFCEYEDKSDSPE